MRRHAIWIILVSFLLSGCRLGAVETEAGDPVVLTGVRRRPSVTVCGTRFRPPRD